ncbi:hypothetical protein GC175_04455 [bacterium]|nr:hypothetical protein [bacterium]
MKHLIRSRSIWTTMMVMLALILGACTTETRDMTGVGADAVVIEEPGGDDQAQPLPTETGEEQGVVAEEVTPEAGTEAEEAPVDADTEATVGMGLTGLDQETMILASTLLDRGVENPNGADLGHVDDFLIELDTGNVLFALIEHGGFLGIGNEHAAVPLNALALGPERNNLILNLAEDAFESFPNVEVTDDWPMGLDETWDDDLNVFWNEAGFNTRNLEGAAPGVVGRASQLVGFGLGAPGAAATPGFGTTLDYVVDLAEGRVKYALVGFTDVVLYGQDWAVIPFEAMDPTAFASVAALDPAIDVSLLADAPRIRATEVETIAFFEPGWDESIRTYWAEQGYDLD